MPRFPAVARFRVALVGPEVEENLSLRYLCAALERAGLAAELFPFNAGADLPVVLQALASGPWPEVIALSLSFQWRAHDVLALAVALRERGFTGHLTAGGHFASFAWREVMTDFPELDSLCRFEAEDTLLELCLAVQAHSALDQVAGLAVRGASGPPRLTAARQQPALETLPWPDRRGPAASCLGHGIAAMIGSRGCYANCAFCCIATLHRHAAGARRHRERPADDVAQEMVHLQRERGIDIFIFHDDNFFLPRQQDSLRRVHALADALESRGAGKLATVVKARPNDLTEEIVLAMRERFGLVRLFLGVESSTPQGCATLGRGVAAGAAKTALQLLDKHGLYVCFNMLVFDPDATADGLLQNMQFIEEHGEHPSNFGRVELYAGTPLLERMQQENRAEGDYLGWSYEQGSAEMQRIFELTLHAFHARNFSGRALANRLQSTRFDVEVARHFHPDRFKPAWGQAARALSRRLASSSASGVRRIVQHVRQGGGGDEALLEGLEQELRACEAAIEAEAWQLEQEVSRSVGASCDHAPAKGIPIPRSEGETAEVTATVAGCGVAR
jgi:radical SAM superfamily enzyme YgiQ (UPF0313 family)